MRKRTFLLVQSLLCAVSALLLCLSAVRLCLEGLALREAGDPLAWIYTREKAAAALLRALPACSLALAWAVIGRVLGIRGGQDGRPVPVLSPVKKPRPFRGQATVRLVLLAAALGLIAAGVLNGGLRDVLVKAVNLCTECVGLG